MLVKIRSGGCFHVSPGGVLLQSLQPCLNTVPWERFQLRTWLDLHCVGHIADFCSIFQDSQDLLTSSQFNFIIYKYKHYRWQKRILQVTLKILTFEAIYKKYRMLRLLGKYYEMGCWTTIFFKLSERYQILNKLPTYYTKSILAVISETPSAESLGSL